MFTVTKAGLIPMPINLCSGCIGALQGNLRCGHRILEICEPNHGGSDETRDEQQVGARGKPEQQSY
jgi:hypothetical protein